MKIYALNYANGPYLKARALNTSTAYKHGVDRVFEFGPEDIDEKFAKDNEYILSQKRGNGCWLWKPYFILKVLLQCDEGDWVIYSDSGLYYRKNVRSFIDNLEKQGIDFLLQNTRFIEKEYTKRITFVKMNADEKKYTDTLQRAGTPLIKKTDENVHLVEEWLKYCGDRELITKTEAEEAYENYPGFIEDREDQSILSVLSKKYEKQTGHIFIDIVFPYKGNAILTYHHTRSGSIVIAWCLSIKRWAGIIFSRFRIAIWGEN